MLTLFLVRHASHDLLGRMLAGRMPGVSLNAQGRAEAERLATRLEGERVDRIITSPLDRARETAAAIATRIARPVEVAEELNELDCGAWTGANFEELNKDPRWRAWNDKRADAGMPGGETMGAVQQRAMSYLRRLAAAGEGRIALVSHADVVKAVVAAILGLSLDRHDALVIDPASLTTVQFWVDDGRVVRLNEGPAP